MRVEVDLSGAADHAGTTPRGERRDALLAAARLIVRADDLAGPEMVTTAGRILAEPNAPTTVASRVRLWLDARAPHPEQLDAWWEGLEGATRDLEAKTGVAVRASVASLNRGITFDETVRGALSSAATRAGPRAPEIVCFAGHDAGVVAQRRPAGMVLIRNATGVSHAPGEDVDLEDAAAAARVVEAALEALV
jgi:beta-ureidopropionase / N-carbamoyl-L-amino-acid hydrolase